DEKSKAATNQVEHMWIGPVTYNEEDATFTGRLGNVPNRLEDYELGDEITRPVAEISDWMYIDRREPKAEGDSKDDDDSSDEVVLRDRGVLVGGFTIRMLRDGLSEEKREEFDASVPFEILPLESAGAPADR
ncbi:MAG: DUF2314 domain-containing protein, partial [Pirellulales bacterium]|nr:DUF2314 domain-containing protein [Pirellulales bacterium]